MQAPNPVAWTLGAILVVSSVPVAALTAAVVLPVMMALAGVTVLAGTFLVAHRNAAPEPRDTLIIEKVVSPGLLRTKAVGTSRMDKALLLAIGRPEALLDLRSPMTARRDPLFLPKPSVLHDRVDAVVAAHGQTRPNRRPRPTRARQSRRGRKPALERRVRSR